MITAQQVHEIVEANRQEIIDCLVDIIKTPSITTEEVPVSKVFCKWIEKAGIQAEIHGIAPEHPNVFGEWFGSMPGKRFIFNGHMDTFPPVEGDPGLYGPFSGKVTDTHIYGRGTCDMKGGDAAALMAVTLLKRMGFDPKGSILLSYMCDEEIGGRYGVKWCVEQNLLNGDFGICPEPTSGRILLGHGGIYRLWIIYNAEPTASAHARTEPNALEKAIKAIGALEEYRKEVESRFDARYGHPNMGITTIHAGDATNVHAAQARFSIDRRMVPGETHASVEKEILGVLDNLKAEDPTMDYTIELISDRPVLDNPVDSDIIQACIWAYEQVNGKPAETYYRQGGSDAATIQSYNGILMPNWSGANDFDEPTTPNEKIVIADYLKTVEAFMMTLIKLMS